MWHVGTAWRKVFERVVKNDQREPELPLERFSITPSKSPPRNAPGMDPMPPNTAAVKALIPGIEPRVG